MKRYLSFSFLMCLAVLNVGLGTPINKAIASTPTNNYCIDQLSVPVGGELHSPDNSNRINIREQPSTSSKILHVGSTGKLVIIHKQVVGDDGYCWFWVKFYKSQVTGWVRGDLLDIYLDY
jgi:Bacterial SH3 domain